MEMILTGQQEILGETTMADETIPSTGKDPEGDGAENDGSTGDQNWWRKKWLLVGFIGMLLAFGIGGAALFILTRQQVLPRTIGAKLSAKLPEIAEQLPDFLVPLEPDDEKVVLRVSLALHWPQEVRARYKQRQVAIRNEIYHLLSEIVFSAEIDKKGDGLKYKQKAELESQITRIFERELGPGQLIVLVKKADFL